MSCLLVRHCKTAHFLVYEQGVVKMAQYADVCFEQQAVTEFHVAEKE
jgi:hypothetical protein